MLLFFAVRSLTTGASQEFNQRIFGLKNTRAFNVSSKSAQEGSQGQERPMEEVKYIEARPLAMDYSVERFPVDFWKIFVITFPDAIQSILHVGFYCIVILGMCEFFNLFA
eukprot:TRINITY_DN1343_c0_g1_i1.p2 TRINITY_DN1343_c0_g1~~TRINITY_DN1343_c0_g1_i1.p2  ORF type:complete len:110 (-),score=10.40 TRINITY_DN1343_c0_g1_i1:86-415(-)